MGGKLRPQAFHALKFEGFPSLLHNRRCKGANYYFSPVVGRAWPEMDTLLRKIKALQWLASISVVLLGLAIFGPQEALAQIHLTKHNLTGNSVNMDSRSGASSEICMFCHTPFGGEPSLTSPLWSRNEPSAAYNTYNSLGTSGQQGAAAPIGSVSILCLSCHDGVQAMNVMINSGGDTNVSNGPIVSRESASDHPFGIQYGGGALSQNGPPQSPGAYSSSLMRDKTFNSAQMTLLNGQPVWWVDTELGNLGVRDKTDMQLYTRSDVTFAGGPVPFVECASCHDPHSAKPIFLRLANSQSAVCKACHNY